MALQSRRSIAVCLLIAVSLVLVACDVDFTPAEDNGMGLNVPYRSQPIQDYCGAASVLMWRLYNGLSEISQDTIYNFMQNWPGAFGVSPNAIAAGAAEYANVFDATVDYNTDPSGDVDVAKRKFFTRQIYSIGRRVPVIPIVEGGYHAGVINGGSWYRDSTDTPVWNEVYFHDPKPAYGPNRVYLAGQWSMTQCPDSYSACVQIISWNATSLWEDGYAAYGETTQVAGGGGDRPGGIRYQY